MTSVQSPVVPTPELESGPPVVSGTAVPMVEEVQYEDYFGFESHHEFTFPDGLQKIYFTSLNEGQKTKFQQKINKDIHLNRQTQDARIKTDPAGERHELIHASVTGWFLKRRNKMNQWEDVPFSGGRAGTELDKWLQIANPVIVERLEEAIRKANPWLMAEMTVEQVDEEIKRLEDLRKEIVAREQREADFSS